MKFEIWGLLFIITFFVFCGTVKAQSDVASDSIALISYDTILSSHSVKSGQSLGYIANLYHCPINILVALNKLPSREYKVKIGELLLVREIKKVVTMKYMMPNNPSYTSVLTIPDSNVSEVEILSEPIKEEEHATSDTFLVNVKIKNKDKERVNRDTVQQKGNSKQHISSEVLAKDSSKYEHSMLTEEQKILRSIEDKHRKKKHTEPKKMTQTDTSIHESINGEAIKDLSVISFEVKDTLTEEQKVFLTSDVPSKKGNRSDKHQIVGRDSLVSIDTFTNKKADAMKNKDVKALKAAHLEKDSLKSIEGKMLKTVELKAEKKKKKQNFGEEVSQVTKEKAAFYLARAMKAIDVKEYQSAEKYTKKALDINPNYCEAWMLHADLYGIFGYYEKAIKDYTKAIESNKNMVPAYYNRGVIYLKMTNLEKAKLDFNKSLELDSSYIVALGGRASVSIYQKDFISAIADYSRIINLNASFSPAYKARGIARLEIGDYSDAISDFSEFIQNDKTDAYVYYQKGLAELKSGKMYDSCIDFLKASEMGSAEAKIAIKKHCD